MRMFRTGTSWWHSTHLFTAPGGWSTVPVAWWRRCWTLTWPLTTTMSSPSLGVSWTTSTSRCWAQPCRSCWPWVSTTHILTFFVPPTPASVGVDGAQTFCWVPLPLSPLRQLFGLVYSCYVTKVFQDDEDSCEWFWPSLLRKNRNEWKKKETLNADHPPAYPLDPLDSACVTMLKERLCFESHDFGTKSLLGFASPWFSCWSRFSECVEKKDAPLEYFDCQYCQQWSVAANNQNKKQ